MVPCVVMWGLLRPIPVLVLFRVGMVSFELHGIAQCEWYTHIHTYVRVFIHIYVCMYVCMYVYIYIYIERERERERFTYMRNVTDKLYL